MGVQRVEPFTTLSSTRYQISKLGAVIVQPISTKCAVLILLYVCKVFPSIKYWAMKSPMPIVTPKVKVKTVNYFHRKIRSSHRRCSVRKGVVRNFPKFTGKHMCQSLFFNKVAGFSLKLY